MPGCFWWIWFEVSFEVCWVPCFQYSGKKKKNVRIRASLIYDDVVLYVQVE